jgi:RNA recognition motif-containing protein
MVKDSSNGKGQDEQYRKLFVGALSLQMTEEDLRTFYSQYGTITDCVVMKDPHTRRSRGFGFVTFAAAEEVDKAMNSRPHVIDGKTVDPKRAVPREASQKNEANMSTKRLYVSGVRDDHQEKDFEEYFSKYGVVEKVKNIFLLGYVYKILFLRLKLSKIKILETIVVLHLFLLVIMIQLINVVLKNII